MKSWSLFFAAVAVSLMAGSAVAAKDYNIRDYGGKIQDAVEAAAAA
jgi:hypothetical protein